MAFVITDKCINEQYALCKDVCPVDCIFPGLYENKPFMVIDPTLCINCDACLIACPVGAIVESEEKDPVFAEINRKLADKFKYNPDVLPRKPDDPPNRSDNQLLYSKK